MKSIVVVVCFASAGFAAAARAADACSCAPPPPPCEAFWTAGAVFTGKVSGVKPTGQNGIVEATFAIDEKFSGGQLGKSVVVSGGGMCGSEFEVGKQYIVYAGGSNGLWHSSLCSRTALLSEAADDLAYAHAIPKRTFAVVEGKVMIENETGTMSTRSNVVVSAQGTKQSTRTDGTGQYKLQLPAGTYTLDVTDPGTRVQWGKPQTITLANPAACARHDIIEVWNGRIQGKLTDHTGAPAANIAVSAHAVGGSQNWRLDGHTDAGGNYEIPEVQKGSYIVAVGAPDEGGPDEHQPIPTTYYPGVSARTQAKKITMTRAGLVTKIDFKLPKPLAVYTISGVLAQAGKPLANTMVKITNDALQRATGGNTDANGVFKFREIAGATVTLEVCRPGANAQNYQTACKQTKRRIDADVVVDLEMP